ncbi:nitrous oxide-stimulated promoter family protein [Campylobacter hominis]|uniref:Nitrous oxide-stimulated promoter family protein n=1 Tax=Campylobacter hominis (strain ATCC BAA-381 / DSM 21671 / CCUG 45161 / LMG 19568 / NCTC 13146 / CH001A) TaxID=360107 RepID=A7I237_CAMHC|nr:nitrous oxide-stimulated promoter family protein [Campylobacter hominis]ABS51270.1 conserved hypothetical protein [Campylobacter hominis ATCC BAA-381]UAK86151.1 nitrous oxide-stimulated promoter family protein [Campylobacter hominis]SUW85101.1 Nitrous oxide-stimulated promoter [Campylobacter hominis]
MTKDKFIQENSHYIELLQKFCNDKFGKGSKLSGSLQLNYKGEFLGELPYELCKECEELLFEINEKFLTCPIAKKPKCSECLQNCFKPEIWKKIELILPKQEQDSLSKIKEFLNKEII